MQGFTNNSTKLMFANEWVTTFNGNYVNFEICLNNCKNKWSDRMGTDVAPIVTNVIEFKNKKDFEIAQEVVTNKTDNNEE